MPSRERLLNTHQLETPGNCSLFSPSPPPSLSLSHLGHPLSAFEAKEDTPAEDPEESDAESGTPGQFLYSVIVIVHEITFT